MKAILKLFMFLLLLPVVVYADSLIVTCPEKVSAGQEFTCSIKGETTKGVADLKISVGTAADINYVGFTASGWAGSGEDGLITLYSSANKIGTFDIGTVKLKKISNESSKITFYDIVFYGENGSKTNVAEVTKDIAINVVNNNEQPSNNVVTNNQVTNNNNNNVNNNNNAVVDNNKKDGIVETPHDTITKDEEPKESDAVTTNEPITTTGNTQTKTNYVWIFIVIIVILIMINVFRMLMAKKNDKDVSL